jgi:multicomponent Na+:H+ antiporter subunit G
VTLTGILALGLIFIGLFIILIGSLGVVRFPNIYSRLHAGSAADTIGTIFVLIGFLLKGEAGFEGYKIGLLIVFIFITGPIITHKIAKSAFLSRRDFHYKSRREKE